MELQNHGRCDNSNFNTFKGGIHMVSPLKFNSNLPNRRKHILIKFALSWASMKIILNFLRNTFVNSGVKNERISPIAP